MRRLRSGFTLLEVLVALLVITIALLGMAGTLGPISALAGEGRAQGRIALALESRVDRLRAELLASAPSCSPPAPGFEIHPDGVRESWSTASRGGLIEIRIEASAPGLPGALTDSLVTRLPCP